jgi:hypothetical protein
MLGRSLPALGLALLAVTAAAGQAHAQTTLSSFVAFDGVPIGPPPSEFTFGTNRLHDPGVWEIRGTATARHLVHLPAIGVPPRGLSIALPTRDIPKNVRIVARIRFAEGEQAGGVVWRYRDSNNFYAVAVDLILREVFLFRVSGGNRIRLDHSADATLDAAVWHQVGVSHVGDQIRVHVDGINVLSARDPFILEGGRAGVWSAGGSLTWFDDIRIEELAEKR